MCFSLYLGIGREGGGGALKGLVRNLLMQSFTLGSSKIEVFETYFQSPKMTMQDMQSMFQAVFMCFSPYLGIGCGGGGGGSKREWYTTCLCTFSSLYSSKMEVSETFFLML